MTARCKAAVTRLSARDFRNLQNAELFPGPGVNLFLGDNAQGKTNLMEAVWLFTGERSFRGARDTELTRFGADSFRLELDFTAPGGEHRASLSFSGVRQAALDGVKLSSAAELAGHFPAVAFSPEDLSLAKGAPQLRRRFLNAAIAQLFPRYGAELARYSELLRQRNALLKDIPRHAELLDTLDIWDDRLCSLGGSVAFLRLRYLRRLAPRAAEVYRGIAAQAGSEAPPGAAPEELSIAYESPYAASDPEREPPAAAELAAAMAAELKTRRREDLEAGFTGAGPHRDDLALSVGGKPARLFASQGQQRSAVLALKLAEAEVLGESAGISPVLLLDDVMSELDRHRQDYLLHHIGASQVFLTCCDDGLFAGAGPRVFRVQNGALLPE